MIPPGNPLELTPDTFVLLRSGLAAILLLYLPFLGALVGGSAASLALGFLGRERRDAKPLRLSRELIETVAPGNAALFLAALLPLPLIAFLWWRVLSASTLLPWTYWGIPFAAVLSGCALIALYRSAVRRTAEPPALHFGAGAAAVLSLAFGAFVTFVLLGPLVNPAKLPLVAGHPVFIPSWASLAEFHLFLALSIGLTGGIVLFLSGRPGARQDEADPGFGAYARSVGAVLAVAGALAVPAIVVLYLVSLPPAALSTEVFAAAAAVLVMALGAVLILHVLPGGAAARPGTPVCALYLLMFLAVLAGDQAVIGNAYQGRLAPKPLQAEGPISEEDRAAAPSPAAEAGRAVFERACRACHLFETRIVGPPLFEVVPKYRGDREKLERYIRDPVKSDPAYPPMPKPALKEEEIDSVARYLLARAEGRKGEETPAGAVPPSEGEGKAVFERICVPCHRFEGRLVGPALNDVVPKYRGDVEKLKRFVRDPVKVDPAYPSMPKHALTEKAIDAVARYLLATAVRGS